MKKFFLLLLLPAMFTIHAAAQVNTLFSESHLNTVYIDLPLDSLSYILSNYTLDHYCKARFVFDDGKRKDTLSDAGFRLRGNTSRMAQKKSFKISFNEYVAGRRFQGVKKINLNGEHNDPTMIREKLYFDIWKRAGMPERRTTFVKLYVNQVYMGVYTLLEEYDKDWLKRVYGEDDGNLYKCTWPADLVYINGDQQTYKNIISGSITKGRAYDLQTNETTDDYTDLVNLITQLNQTADAAFEQKIGQYLNVDSFLKAFAIDVSTGNWDDYAYLKNNYYLYYHQATNRIEFIAYDTDNTFGIDWFNIDWAKRNCLKWYSDSEKRPLATKLLAIPSFMKKFQCYLDTISRQVINPDVIFPHIDSLKAFISDAALTDQFRTKDYGYNWTAFNNGFTQKVDSHTPYGIKPFISTRQTSTLQTINPLGTANNQLAMAGKSFTMFPNPANTDITLITPYNESNRSVTLTNNQGKQVLTIEWIAGSKQATIPVGQLPRGMYTVSVRSVKGVSSSKLMVR